MAMMAPIDRRCVVAGNSTGMGREDEGSSTRNRRSRELRLFAVHWDTRTTGDQAKGMPEAHGVCFIVAACADGRRKLCIRHAAA
jgi:hypothetical protein